jgi:hypothetical protein
MNDDTSSVTASDSGSTAPSNNQQVPNLEGLDEFKEKIKQWLSIDNQIRDLKNKIKVLQSGQGDLTPQIINFMSKNEIHNMNLGDNGKLKFVKRETSQTITQKLLKQKLVEFLEDEDKGIEVFEQIINSREKKQNVALKRLV